MKKILAIFLLTLSMQQAFCSGVYLQEVDNLIKDKMENSSIIVE